MISIIVPIFNGERYLDTCIQSVLHQDSSEWELILVNDGSTDNSEQICTKYLIDNRIKYLYKKNSGVQDARWLGIENASCSYIAFLDSDDLLHPSAVRLLNEQIKQDVDIIIFKYQHFTDNYDFVPIVTSLCNENIIDDRISIMKRILSGKMLSCVYEGVYKRNLLIENRNLFCNDLKIGEDTMFNLEVIYKASPHIKIFPYQLYYYRNNVTSVMHTFNQKKFSAIYDTIQYLENFLYRSNMRKILKKEASFRLLLLWSTFVFHPDNIYYCNKKLRNRMKRLYFPAFRYLYPYLKVYLFVDFFLFKLVKHGR